MKDIFTHWAFNACAGIASIVSLLLTWLIWIRTGRIQKAILSRARLPDVYRKIKTLLKNLNTAVNKGVDEQFVEQLPKLSAHLTHLSTILPRQGASQVVAQVDKLTLSVQKFKQVPAHEISRSDRRIIVDDVSQLAELLDHVLRDQRWRIE